MDGFWKAHGACFRNVWEEFRKHAWKTTFVTNLSKHVEYHIKAYKKKPINILDGLASR